MISLTDSLGHPITLLRPPTRIVSVVPSLTELVADLGAEAQLVGITQFCIHPSTVFQTKIRVGGTKKLHLDRIQALRPDLILANKEENVKEQIEFLQTRFPVYTTRIANLAEACQAITDIGLLIDRVSESNLLRSDIEIAFESLRSLGSARKLKVLYLIWKDPYLSVGGDTFIHDMLSQAGFENVCASMLRYPTLSADWIRHCDADLIWLSSEPFPFQEKHLAEFQALLPQSQVQLVEGDYFSWYGSRLKKAAVYLSELAASRHTFNPNEA